MYRQQVVQAIWSYKKRSYKKPPVDLKFLRNANLFGFRDLRNAHNIWTRLKVILKENLVQNSLDPF